MTQEELDAAIRKIILPQSKPRSTQNSHRRKQWENRRYWHLCTMSKSCKLGYVKICPIARQKPFGRNILKSSICLDCCCYGEIRTPWGCMAGISCSCDTISYYRRFSNKCQRLKYFNNRWVRRHRGEIGNYGYYKKMFEYEYFL